MIRKVIKCILNMEAGGQEIAVDGWVRTRRTSKEVTFFEINDGSTVRSLQVVLEKGFPNYE